MSNTAVKSKARDLDSDLAICEAATPGPWITMGDGSIATEKTDRDGWHDNIIHPRTPRPGRNITQFIAESRQGWPYAIHRALEAEREIDRLRDEINMLQEQLNQHHRSHNYD